MDQSISDEAIVEGVLMKDRAIIAGAISIVESGDIRALSLSNKIYPHTGKACRIGITGPPGAGKSTLTAELARHARKQGSSVGIIAIDPSSPVSKGAVLGDRIRMHGIEADEEVFIRSMATRGMTGGLSAMACEAADILDAAGFDYVFLESVGIGQVDLKIEKFVDTTIVVLVPESGDQVQAIKAGLMEIADIYVLNKSDREGSANVLAILQTALGFHQDAEWSPQVIRSVATKGEGSADIIQQIEKHREYLNDDGKLEARRIAGMKARVYDKVNEMISTVICTSSNEQLIEDSMSKILAGEISPQQLADQITERLLKR